METIYRYSKTSKRLTPLDNNCLSRYIFASRMPLDRDEINRQIEAAAAHAENTQGRRLSGFDNPPPQRRKNTQQNRIPHPAPPVSPRTTKSSKNRELPFPIKLLINLVYRRARRR